MEVYLDEERLKGGQFFNTKLAQAICESVCLIVVYTPTYFSDKNSYCAREYRAMEELEQLRFEKLGLMDNFQNGLIIPLIYRGNKKLPESLKSSRQCYFLEEFQITGHANLSNPEYAQIIKEIAEYIDERCDELRNVENEICSSCDTFEIPSESEISIWIKDMLPLKPKLPNREKAG